MSARFRMCTGLANACQELGFQAEVGYQTFLYSSVKDWRKLLMFLLEKLPKEAAQTADEPTGAGILLTRSIGAEIGASLRAPWTPSYCKRESGSSGLHAFTASDVQAPTGTGDLQKKIPKEVKLYYAQEMPYVVAQPVLTRDVLSSLLAKNDSEVAAQQEWEAEWNQAGLASRLSEN
uniref:Uncharacterized protein n=1 Tax=Amphimedon queenslandica TaxID=400682 RepID=A0A1X7SGJ6_AMPQE